MTNIVNKKDFNNIKNETRTEQFKPELWFNDCEIYKIPIDKQRQVLLNPGVSIEKTKVIVSGKGQVPITQMVYQTDLPVSLPGKIIWVTGIKQGGQIKPKPMGTYYELFESNSGYRVWVNPQEYISNERKINNKQHQNQIPKFVKRSSVTIADTQSGREVLGRLKSGRSQQDGQTSRNQSQNRITTSNPIGPSSTGKKQ